MFYTLLFTFIVGNGVHWSVQQQRISYEQAWRHPHWPLLDQGTNCGTEFPENSPVLPELSPRVIGGGEVTPREFPWMALVILEFGNGNVSFTCGASLINQKYVLTAAHCCELDEEVLEMGGRLTTVRLGEHNFATLEDQCLGGFLCNPPKDFEVEEILPHEGYNNDSLHNDICLLRLKESVTYSKDMYPICLPVYDELRRFLVGSTMTLAGWGVSKKDGIMVTDGTLNKVDVDVKHMQTCLDRWGDTDVLLRSQMCAGGDLGRDSCAGDSGGPLMLRAPLHGPPRYFVTGLVSFGRQCSSEDKWLNEMDLWKPGVYTRVSDYILWILNNIRP